MLTALDDESCQHLMLAMMRMGDCSGVRAVDIAERINLSRPAVSHHLQIMKDAGLLKTRKEGTKNTAETETIDTEKRRVDGEINFSIHKKYIMIT